jgi:hypothetical protein
MAKKITKEDVAEDKKATKAPKKSKSKSTKIKKEEAVSSSSTPKEVDIEALKEQIRAEVKGEILSDSGAVEIKFQKTIVEGSKKMADKLNNEDYKIAIWETDDGEPSGYIEEVKINGAVAQIPKGVSVYVPVSVKKLIEGYKEAEKITGDDIVNQQGTRGIKADRNEATKRALEN